MAEVEAEMPDISPKLKDLHARIRTIEAIAGKSAWWEVRNELC